MSGHLPSQPARAGRSTRDGSGIARRAATILSLTLLLGSVIAALGAEDDESSKDEAAKQRLEMMRRAIDDFQVRLLQGESTETPKFRDEPLLRYNDQTRLGENGVRTLLDATTWRLGETGRPLAIVTLEVYPSGKARALMTYEFVALSSLPLEMKNSHGVIWTPSRAALTMTPLPDAPEPADTKRARLSQKRQLARRFTAQAEWHGEKVECRLLSQPIDSYDDEAAGVMDGAVFVFANGTNPELGLLLECSEELWSYGVFRLTAAKLWAQLDGKSFDLPSKGTEKPVEAPTTAAGQWIDLPE